MNYYPLIDVRAPSADYLLLESLTLEKNAQRIVHMFTPTAGFRSYKLGRGHDTDLRINDISVSRCHAIILAKHDGFYLQDNASKFGTLVLVRHQLELQKCTTQAVQVGRTVINFQISDVREKPYSVGEYLQKRKLVSEQ